MDKEDLLKKHRLEKKQLQVEIQAIKKSVPKGDRKRDKEAKKQIQELENSLKEKQNSELVSFEKPAEILKVEKLSIKDENKSEIKLSKAQRRRKNLEEKARLRDQEIEEAEKNASNAEKHKERVAILEKLKPHNLTIKEMKPDGNCLYYAVLDQIPTSDDVLSIRLKVANYLRENYDNLNFFLTDPNSGDCFDREKYEEYCCKTEMDGFWGGQIELRAISSVYRQQIQVIQAYSPNVIIGDEFQTKPIYLTYHRHQLSLGEHYNSIQENQNSSEDF